MTRSRLSTGAGKDGGVGYDVNGDGRLYSLDFDLLARRSRTPCLVPASALNLEGLRRRDFPSIKEAKAKAKKKAKRRGEERRKSGTLEHAVWDDRPADYREGTCFGDWGALSNGTA